MTKTILIVLAVLGGSCCLLGGAIMLLGLTADDAKPGAVAAAAAGPVSGDHPKELVGFWSSGSHKLALFPDGTAKRWVRYRWNGTYGTNTCKLDGDLTGTWSASGQQLTLEMTEGRWQNCYGEQPFNPSTETWQWRHQWASGIGKKVMWLKDATSESGYNLECESPSGCSFEPAPMK